VLGVFGELFFWLPPVANAPVMSSHIILVMTTIGYGNASPTTVGGRAMVYLLGSISILLFGGVSARAAYVITSLLEETLLWGAIYCAWMLTIAVHYIQWQESRLGNKHESLAEGYWFAYISTTTIGFGDYYLKPSVLELTDLFIYPILFLMGFSFLAAFLSKLSDLFVRPILDGETLVSRFKKADDKRAAEQDISKK
jgi:Ion channel